MRTTRAIKVKKGETDTFQAARDNHRQVQAWAKTVMLDLCGSGEGQAAFLLLLHSITEDSSGGVALTARNAAVGHAGELIDDIMREAVKGLLVHAKGVAS